MSDLPAGDATQRERSYDLLKGVGILAVIVLHSTGRSASKFAHVGDGMWWTLNVLNLLANFGVPLFLLISAIVWTQSYLRRSDWRDFYARRARGVVVPYLVWSAIYLVARDTRAHSWVLGPRALINDVLWGKASFHLYFMSILIQFGLLLPVFVWALRRFDWGFYAITGATVVKQGIVFEIQHLWLKFAYPATLAVWYLAVLVPGAWIGLKSAEWPRVWGRLRLPCSILAVLGTGSWLWISIVRLEKLPIQTMPYNWANLAFYASICLCLIGFSSGWAEQKGWGTEILIRLGSVSIQLYLMHPLVMDLISLPRFASFLASLSVFAPIVSFVLTLAITYGFAECLMRLRLDPILFGKAGPRKAA